MVWEKSCGALVVRREEDKYYILMIRHRAGGKRSFPKGHVEGNESEYETALREVMEETGLQVQNIRYYKSQPWGFTDNILVGFYCEVDGASDIVMDREELSVAEWVECADIEVLPEDLSLTNEMICKFCIDKSNS